MRAWFDSLDGVPKPRLSPNGERFNVPVRALVALTSVLLGTAMLLYRETCKSLDLPVAERRVDVLILSVVKSGGATLAADQNLCICPFPYSFSFRKLELFYSTSYGGDILFYNIHWGF